MRTMIRQIDRFSKRLPLAVASGSLALFLLLTALVLRGVTDTPDRRLSRAIERADAPWLTLLLDASSAAAMPLMLSLAIPIGLLLLRRRYRPALLFSLSAVGIAALNLALKLALHHNPPGGGSGRPIDWRTSPLAIAEQISNAYSYPSGHVAATVVALGLWLGWLWPRIPQRLWRTLLIAAIGSAASIAYSRVYLGHHVAVDTLGGGLLGVTWLAGTLVVGMRGRGCRPPPQRNQHLR